MEQQHIEADVEEGGQGAATVTTTAVDELMSMERPKKKSVLDGFNADDPALKQVLKN